jgi:hypothetical protein
MTRAKDISKIITDADLSGTLDVTGTVTASGLTVTQTGTTTATIGATGTVGDNDGTLIINNGGTGDGMLRFDYESASDRARIGVSASSQNLQFYTAGNNERMRITSSGNVSIGSTNNGTSGALDVSIGSVSTSGGITLWSPTDSEGGINFGDGYTGTDRYRGSISYRHDVDSMKFLTSSAERMRIDSSGNIGIGTSSPTTTLDVYGNINLRGGYNLTWGGAYGANIPTIIGTNGAGANISFYPAGSTSGESMRIDSSGNFLVGTTSQIGAGKTSIAFDRTSQWGMAINNTSSTAPNPATMIEFQYAGTSNGYIQSNGSSTSYNTSSDHRLKENVSYDFDATTRLKQLRPARFNFIADADTTVDGFLAHEVQSVVPEAITGTHNEVDDDGNPVYQGIDQSKLVPLLVKTIQELEARIVALETA